MVLESRRDSFASMGIPLYKFDHLCFFFLLAPGMEGVK
jgi:hypothetical protein